MNRIIQRFCETVDVVAGALLGLVTLLIVASTVARYFFAYAIPDAFDISRYSFRTREYAEYKGTRAETPPEFVGQVPLLEEALKAMGIATISKEDFEADDILATLSTQGAEQGFRV